MFCIKTDAFQAPYEEGLCIPLCCTVKMPLKLSVPLRTGAKDGSAAGAKPGRIECEQGRKWVVEHHTNNPEIIIAETNPKQAVYIYGCKNSTVQVLHPSGHAAPQMMSYVIKSQSQVVHMHATHRHAQW